MSRRTATHVGFMGNTFVETPHINALATQGLVFTQAHASTPNCAPNCGPA